MCKHLGPIVLLTALYVLAHPAFAISECQVHLVQIWTGVNGETLLVFDNSSPVYVYGPTSVTDVTQRNAVAFALSAFAMDSPLTVRYQADGVVCASGPSRQDFAGIWIQR